MEIRDTRGVVKETRVWLWRYERRDYGDTRGVIMEIREA